MAGDGQPLLARLKPFVPLGLKRRLRKTLPARYRRFWDPDWHRATVRGTAAFWEELGRLQLDYLVGQGLQESHYVLDVGCGPLRAGVHFIRYLEPGHYAGIDIRGDNLEYARKVELPRQGLEDKNPILLVNGAFEFEKLGQTFDYAIAQSVFTHLDLNSISRCLVEMAKVLRPGGGFYATIYENPQGKKFLEDIRQSERVTSHYDRNYYHYDVETLRAACEGTGLKMEYMGDWGHPDNQKMVRFSRADG
jgi:SAM-dependent methyltransferase